MNTILIYACKRISVRQIRKLRPNRFADIPRHFSNVKSIGIFFFNYRILMIRKRVVPPPSTCSRTVWSVRYSSIFLINPKLKLTTDRLACFTSREKDPGPDVWGRPVLLSMTEYGESGKAPTRKICRPSRRPDIKDDFRFTSWCWPIAPQLEKPEVWNSRCGNSRRCSSSPVPWLTPTE